MVNNFTVGLQTTMSLNGVATIESGSQTSAAIPNSGRAVVRLGFPTITSTTLTFQVQAYPLSGDVAAASFRSLVDKDGNAVSYTIASDTVVTIPELSGCASFKFIMGSAEGSDRSIEVTSRGDNPVVSPTEIDVDIEGSVTVAATTAATSNGYGAPVTVTRPANMTPYSANDVVGGAIDLGVMGPSACNIILQSVRLELDISSIPSGMTSFYLSLYSATPPSALADNAAFDVPSGDRASWLGIVNIGTPVDYGATCQVELSNIGKELLLASTHLFCYLVTVGGYTPAANSEVYVLTGKGVAI